MNPLWASSPRPSRPCVSPTATVATPSGPSIEHRHRLGTTNGYLAHGDAPRGYLHGTGTTPEHSSSPRIHREEGGSGRGWGGRGENGTETSRIPLASHLHTLTESPLSPLPDALPKPPFSPPLHTLHTNGWRVYRSELTFPGEADSGFAGSARHPTTFTSSSCQTGGSREEEGVGGREEEEEGEGEEMYQSREWAVDDGRSVTT